MDMNVLINAIQGFVVSHPYISLTLLALYLLFLYKKTQQALKLLAIVVFGVATFYIFSQIQDAVFSGVDHKEDIIQKQEQY